MTLSYFDLYILKTLSLFSNIDLHFCARSARNVKLLILCVFAHSARNIYPESLLGTLIGQFLVFTKKQKDPLAKLAKKIVFSEIFVINRNLFLPMFS